MKTRGQRAEEFICKARAMVCHSDIDYSLVADSYIDSKTPVPLYDKSLRSDGTPYGLFYQSPSNHLKGRCHPDKKIDNISRSKRLSQQDVIKRFMEVHKGENLDYSKVKYVNMHTKVCIICHELRPDGTEYGEFWQEPVVHLKGCTHPQLSIDRNATKNGYTNSEFIEKCKIVHSDKNYDYSLVDYKDSRTKVKVVCNEIGSDGKPHGIFMATPDNFLQGKGCPKCGRSISLGEEWIFGIIAEKLGNDNVQRRVRNVVDGYEIDVYIPSLRIGIEFNGLRWHSELFGKGRHYHLDKMKACNAVGITLFQVFEDEYLLHREALKHKLLRLCNIDDDAVKIGARECVFEEYSHKEAAKFFDANHIQGFSSSTFYFGLKCKRSDSVVAMMSFTKNCNGSFELTRYATKLGFSVQGGASKLLKHSIEAIGGCTIYSFLDLRYCKDADNNLYTRLGFKLDKTLPPNYSYTDGHGRRMHKFGFRKKHLSRKYGFDMSLTESEMCEKLGYHKIWDCGLLKYVYYNK